MKNAIVILSLIAGAQAASADVFAPWETRAVIEDVNVKATGDAAISGFAPWESRDVGADVIDRDALVVETPASVF
ncbi:MAG: hypothetical protein KJO38_03480, partial [Gammaproteobacteria bacterium]|nr:hypothetical protein [Gammaproteobacteria bacterium]